MDERLDDESDFEPSGVPKGREAVRDNAILALLQQPSIQRAAESVGMPLRTLYRWLEDPDFAERFKKARRQVFGQAIARIQNLSTTAATTLAKIMVDERAPCHARVSAAIAILRFGREAIELDDLQGRIEALEAKLDAQTNPTIDMPPPESIPPEALEVQPVDTSLEAATHEPEPTDEDD